MTKRKVVMKTVQLFIALLLFIPCHGQYNSHKEQTIACSLWESAFREGITNRQERMVYFAQKMEETPYVAGALEGGVEELKLCFSEVDCITFVESVIALNVAKDSHEIDSLVQQLRYNKGIIDGYGSRLHYTLSWLKQLIEHHWAEDCTASLGGIARNKQICFMSEHASRYAGIVNADILEQIKMMEHELSTHPYMYIPKANINKKVEHGIREGDIILITTAIEGLDISHVGIAIKRDNILKMVHASSNKKCVTETSSSLKEYLQSNKSQDGIIIVRLNNK